MNQETISNWLPHKVTYKLWKKYIFYISGLPQMMNAGPTPRAETVGPAIPNALEMSQLTHSYSLPSGYILWGDYGFTWTYFIRDK